MDPIAPLHTRQKLKMLGFLDNEVTILTVLFGHKKISSKELSQLTSLSFDAVHYSLNILEQKKLVTRTADNGNDIVEICSDKEFLEWVDTQKNKNANIYEEAKSTIEAYLTSVSEASWKPDVMYFEGKQGVIDIYEDILDVGEDTFGWHDIEGIHECIGDYVYEFIERRSGSGITTHAILPDNEFNRSRQQESEKRKVRFSNNLPLKGEIRIYGHKVAVITFDGDKPVGFVFSGSLITSVYKAVFEHAWHCDSSA